MFARSLLAFDIIPSLVSREKIVLFEPSRSSFTREAQSAQVFSKSPLYTQFNERSLNSQAIRKKLVLFDNLFVTRYTILIGSVYRI
jgi:hypothetical protein